MGSSEIATLILGGSGIAALTGVITKFLLDRKKQDLDHALSEESAEQKWNAQEFARLEARILKLEADHAECMEKRAMDAVVLGETRGEVQGLKIILAELQKTSRQEIVQAVASRTVSQAVQSVERVVETAVAKVAETKAIPRASDVTTIKDDVKVIKEDVKDIKERS